MLRTRFSKHGNKIVLETYCSGKGRNRMKGYTVAEELIRALQDMPQDIAVVAGEKPINGIDIVGCDKECYV